MPATRSGTSAGGRSSLSPILVGRTDEQAFLEEALLSASAAEGRLVLLLGDPGVGKTRLVKHAQRRAGELGGGVFAGACDQGTSSLPYLPFVDAIGGHLLRSGAASVRRRLGPLALELSDLFPQLEPRYRRPAGEDPQRSKMRLFEALATLLTTLAEDFSFLLLVVEELQWADGSSLELLAFLARRLRSERILLLATARTEAGALPAPLEPLAEGARREDHLSVVDLLPLSREESDAMAAAILGVARLDPSIGERLYYLSEGRPSVIEELIREAADAATAAGGDWTAQLGSRLAVPKPQAERVLARVQKLDGAHADLVRAAAVLTPPFDVDLLVQVSGLTAREVGAALASAAAAELLEDAGGQFQFRQHFIREAIYEALPAARRRELHLRAARAVQSQSAGAAFEVARHLLASGAGAEAVPACLTAARQAMASKGYEEAARLYSWALPEISDPAERGRVLAALGEALQAGGDRDAALADFTTAVQVLESVGEREEAAHVRLLRGTCEWQSGRPEAAREQFELAVEALEPLGPSETLADGYARLASLHVFQLDGARARELSLRALSLAEAVGSAVQAAWAECFLGIANVLQGDVEAGLASLDGAYETAISNGLDWIAVNAIFNGVAARLDHLRGAECGPLIAKLRKLPGAWMRGAFIADAEAHMLLKVGNVQGAIAAARDAIAEAESTGIRPVATWSRRRLALALAEAGEPEAASAELQSLDAPAERQELLWERLARIRVHLAAGEGGAAGELAAGLLAEKAWLQRDAMLVSAAVEALCLTGHLEEAQALLDSALDGGISSEDPYIEQAFGRLTLAQGFHQEALDHLLEAIGGFARCGYGLEEIRSRLLLAECQAAAGRSAEAGQELRVVVAAAEASGAAALAQAAREVARNLQGGVELKRFRLGSTGAAAPVGGTADGAGEEGRLGLIWRLPVALRDNELVLHYQPQIELEGGSVVAVEALVRWQRPGRPLLPPDRFVPLAEQAGLINELTGWVLDTALRQVAEWQNDGVRMPVAVNLSVHDLERPTFATRVSTALAACRVDPQMLCLEITETSAMQAPGAVVTSMQRLRALGVRLSIDDFGAGQSSLSYLRRLPLDEIKLDKSFCLDLGGSSVAIVRSVVAMAHELGLRVVAEGVEDLHVVQVLKELRCDVGQGHHFGPAVPVDDVKIFGRAAV